MREQELREGQSRQRQFGPKTHLLAHVDGLPVVATGRVVPAEHRRRVAEQPTKTDQVALESTGEGRQARYQRRGGGQVATLDAGFEEIGEAHQPRLLVRRVEVTD